jgi:murein DD-endopeptidase MepM/ murein hydrolase activator NlpD
VKRANIILRNKYKFLIWGLILVLISSCVPVRADSGDLLQPKLQDLQADEVEVILPTPLPTRPQYTPGTLVEYTVQTGDNVAALASHFNTTPAEILEANPIIPAVTTTLPPGLPLQIPIYYEPIWSSPYQILPDERFVNGPAAVGFDVRAFVNSQPGWLKSVRGVVGELERSGADIVIYVSEMFSIDPQLLLALLEYQASALSNPQVPDNINTYVLGYEEIFHQGLAQQLVWAANRLNNGYYTWRDGSLTVYKHKDGRLERPDPWQNAASVALQYYFSQIYDRDEYTLAVSGDGLAAVYEQYFGPPWEGLTDFMPGSLNQPTMILPFSTGHTWAYTGGPHTAWGLDAPFAAVDFAPGSVVGGCSPTDDPALAVADGVISRTGNAFAVLDLDGDGDERTGWSVFYLHLANASIPPVGTQMKQGDPIGLPSCEGGKSTGTHVHIARKYNGEWILAGGVLAFNLEGWIVGVGPDAYTGTLNRNGYTLRACVCSDRNSQITAGSIQ